MKKTLIILIFLFLLAFSSVAYAVEYDSAYQQNFGYGAILASTTGYPPLTQCNMSQFDYRDGVFYIPARSSELYLRFLLKDGQTYGQFMNMLQQADPNKYASKNKMILRTYIWASHNVDGTPVAKEWPTGVSERPKWTTLLERSSILSDEMMEWTTSGVLWKDLLQDGGIKYWLQQAKPGYKLYILHLASYVRDATEDQQWDQQQMRYVIPIEFVDTEPLASATIVIK